MIVNEDWSFHNGKVFHSCMGQNSYYETGIYTHGVIGMRCTKCNEEAPALIVLAAKIL